MCFFPSSFHISVLALTGRHSSLGPSTPDDRSDNLFAFKQSPILSYGTCSYKSIPIYIRRAITISIINLLHFQFLIYLLIFLYSHGLLPYPAEVF